MHETASDKSIIVQLGSKPLNLSLQLEPREQIQALELGRNWLNVAGAPHHRQGLVQAS